MVAMIESLRTGDFRPSPHIYENIESDEPTVGFGIDLRKQLGWRAASPGQDVKATVPPALAAMLEGLTELYPDMPHDRKWRDSNLLSPPADLPPPRYRS